MEKDLLTFGICFKDAADNEYYATVYKSKVPSTLYAVHFYDEVLKDEYDILTIGVVSGEFLIINRQDSLIPNITELVVSEIRKHLLQVNEPIE